MKMLNHETKYLLFTAVSSLCLTACLDSGGEIAAKIGGNSALETPVYSKFNVNLHPVNKTVCDPYDDNVYSDYAEKGVKATLYYKGASMPIFRYVQDYLDLAIKSSQTLFFTDINAPTRLWNKGFSTQTSSVVKDDVGNTLVEYFALKFETTLQLSPDMPEGNYELASLADDGLVLDAFVNGQWTNIISADGFTSTKMGCAKSVISFTHGMQVPIVVKYFQGPRTQIASVLMWRLSSEAGKDVSCNIKGNQYYFDEYNGSVPRQPYIDLLARGWAPIPPKNYFIPAEAEYNPCTAGTDPVIEQVNVDEISNNSAQVIWPTDIPATTQILITNTNTGEETLTETDNILRTNHEIDLSNLDPDTTYEARAVCISDDLGKHISETITFKTSK